MTDVRKLTGAQLKRGDTSPPLRLQLLNDRGEPENLTGWSGAIAISPSFEDGLTVDDSVNVVNEGDGIVEYGWQSGDTDTVGTYECEVVMTDGSDVTTFPNDRYFRVRIMEELQ